MYEKDYIMRVVEAFSRMISIILGYREKGDMDSAYRHILEAYGSVLKVDPEELNSYTDEQWESFCEVRTPQEIEMLAELMKLDGEILMDSGKPEVVCRKLFKALELLKRVEESSDTFSITRFDKIASLEQKLSGSEY